MKPNTRLRSMILAVLLISVLNACGTQETTLTGTERDAVLAFSEPQTDNLLAGLQAGDYAMFSRDFDQAMLDAIDAGAFESLKSDRDAKLGGYVSRIVNRVVQTGDFYAVIYDAVFEKDSAVALRVVFRVAEPHEVSGLWFSK
jgi:hypothetical protein